MRLVVVQPWGASLLASLSSTSTAQRRPAFALLTIESFAAAQLTDAPTIPRYIALIQNFWAEVYPRWCALPRRLQTECHRCSFSMAQPLATYAVEPLFRAQPR